MKEPRLPKDDQHLLKEWCLNMPAPTNRNLNLDTWSDVRRGIQIHRWRSIKLRNQPQFQWRFQANKRWVSTLSLTSGTFNFYQTCFMLGRVYIINTERIGKSSQLFPARFDQFIILLFLVKNQPCQHASWLVRHRRPYGGFSLVTVWPSFSARSDLEYHLHVC